MPSSNNAVPPLRTIYLYITGSCNLNCRHCWIEPDFGDRAKKHLPWATLKTIFEQAKEIGLQSVKVTGGEPFLHPEMVEILYALKAMDLHVTMETNGTLIGAREAQALKDNQVTFSISIDGPNAELHDDLRGVQGAFERTLRGIEAVRQEGLSFQIITCLHRGTRHSLREMAAFAQELGANSLKINPITGVGRSEEMDEHGELLSVPEILEVYHELKDQLPPEDNFRVIFDVPPAFKSLDEIKKKGFGTCGILGILGVLHDGRGGLCGIGEHVKELDFGSLLEPGAVKRMWEENAVLNSIREYIPHQLKGICGRCMVKNYCLGKCVADTYVKTGDLFAGFTFCEEAYALGLFPETRLIPEVAQLEA